MSENSIVKKDQQIAVQDSELGILPAEQKMQMSRKQLVIQAYEAPKIKDIASDKPIKEALVYAFNLLGIPEDKFPKGSARTELVNFIRIHLKKYSVSDIRLAFELGAKGELAVKEGKEEKPLDMSLYDKIFNPTFLCSVMNAYDYHNEEIIREYRRKKSEEEWQKISEEKIPTPEEIRQRNRKAVLDMIVVPYEHYCKTGEDKFAFYCLDWLYDNLNKLGLCELTKGQKNEIYEQAKKEHVKEPPAKSSKKEFEQFKDLMKKINTEGIDSVKNQIIRKAKEIAFWKVINNLRDKKMDLRKELNYDKQIQTSENK